MKDKKYKRGDYKREKERLDNKYIKLKIKHLRSKIGGGVIAVILAILGFMTKNWLFFLIAGIVALFFMAGTFPNLTKWIFDKIGEIFTFITGHVRDFISTIFPPGVDSGGFWPSILSVFGFLNSIWFWIIALAIVCILLFLFFTPVGWVIALTLFGLGLMALAIIGIIKAVRGNPFNIGFNNDDVGDVGDADGGTGAGNKGNSPPPVSKSSSRKKPRRIFGRSRNVDTKSGYSRRYEWPSNKGSPSYSPSGGRSWWSTSRLNPSNWGSVDDPTIPSDSEIK